MLTGGQTPCAVFCSQGDGPPVSKVDASDAYALSVFPFGREDKKTLRVSTEWVVQ